MKDNKALVGLLVVFIFLTFSLGGYIVYDKVISYQKPGNEDINDTYQKPGNDDNSNNSITDISMFPKEDKGIVSSVYTAGLLLDENGNWLIHSNQNFQNIENKVDGIKYSLSCDDYVVWNDEWTCGIIKIRLDSFNTNFYYDNLENGCSNDSHLVITDDYLIEQELSGCGGGGKLNVYNKQGKIVFSDDNSVYLTEYNNESKNFRMIVADNIVYYVTYDKDYSSNYYNLYFKSLNLNDMKMNIIQIFEGTPAGLKN